MEKADPACIENNSDTTASLFILFKGKLSANALLTEALPTLDRTVGSKLTERFPGSSKGALLHYEFEKLRMIHRNALRLCRRATQSHDYPG